MLGFQTSGVARVASMAVACLMLSLTAMPPASGAERRARKPDAQHREEGTRPVTRSRASDDADFSSECVGGYRWIRQFYDANVTAAQVSVPVRCR